MGHFLGNRKYQALSGRLREQVQPNDNNIPVGGLIGNLNLLEDFSLANRFWIYK